MKIKVGDICIFKNGSGKTLKVKVCELRPQIAGEDAVDTIVLENIGGWNDHENRVIESCIGSKRIMAFMTKYLTPIKISLENK